MKTRSIDNHLSDLSATYAKLGRRDRLRIRAWGTLARLTEAKWLEANGWFRTPDGWLPPSWHPKSPERMYERTRWSHLYDQNHAANSQRKYRETTVFFSPRTTKRLPAYPAYVRYAPYQFVVVLLAIVLTPLGVWSVLSTHMILLASALLVCVSFAIAWSQARDLRREYVEAILKGPVPDDETTNDWRIR